MCKIKRLTFFHNFFPSSSVATANFFSSLVIRGFSFYLRYFVLIVFECAELRCWSETICPPCFLFFRVKLFLFMFRVLHRSVKTTIVVHTSRYHLVKFLCFVLLPRDEKKKKKGKLQIALSAETCCVCCYSFIYQNKHFYDILNRISVAFGTSLSLPLHSLTQN